MKKILLSTILAIAAIVTLNAQNKLTVEVVDIDNPTGDLYIALYDSNSPFLSIKAIAGKIEAVKGNSHTVVFEGLEKGEYAIAIFQDENKNGKLDLGEYGIPTEKYGFSNNVDPAELMRPPVFDECKFEVSEDIAMTINLASAIKK